MNRRNFMKLSGITMLAPVCGIAFGSTFPRTRFYLNGQLFRDFPKDFAREDEQNTEKFLTDRFNENKEFDERFGKYAHCIAHNSLGHGNVRVSKKWTGDALFLRKVGETDFFCNDSDLTLRNGKIWLIRTTHDS